MATDIVACARRWIGTPYVHQASLKGIGCDCLGLIRGVWREVRGDDPKDVPPYTAAWDIAGGEALRDGLAMHLDPIACAAIAPGDIVLFRMRPGAPACHAAIFTGTTLIHCRQNKRVGEEPFTAFWRARLAYAFRF